MYCTHDLADGSVFGGRSCGEAVEDDGVARLQGGAHKVDENERCNAGRIGQSEEWAPAFSKFSIGKLVLGRSTKNLNR